MWQVQGCCQVCQTPFLPHCVEFSGLAGDLGDGIWIPGVPGMANGGWSWASEGLLAHAPSSSVRLFLAVGSQAVGQAGPVLEGSRVTLPGLLLLLTGERQPVPQPALPPISEGPSLGFLTGSESPLSLGRGLASRAGVCLPSFTAPPSLQQPAQLPPCSGDRHRR